MQELFQDLDGFNLGDYKKCADDGRNMKRLMEFVAAEAEFSGYRYHPTGDDVIELIGLNGEILPFTKDRDKAIASDSLQLFGIEHPVITQMMRDATDLPPEKRALVCKGADSGPHGVLIYWKIHVLTSQGKSSFHIIKIGISPAGEREPALERCSVFYPDQRHTTMDWSACQKNARDILMREMEYEGVIPEGASYSLHPLAIYAV